MMSLPPFLQFLLDGIPLNALIGGLMIGMAAVGLYLSLGRIAGISGILFTSLGRQAGMWRWMFVGGLISGAGIMAQIMPELNVVSRPNPGLPVLIAAGLIVGWGTRLGSGCTSGHGVCGLGRLSIRSLVAVGSFMASGILVATLLRHTLGLA
jgi:uncharacterized membrane protein YedE/YeeE